LFRITPVVIKASTGRQVDTLMADLGAPSAITRDGAVARLTVIGERAVSRLMALVADRQATTAARVAAIHALEGIGDMRAFDPALAALDDADPAIGAAAIGVLQVFLTSARGMDALDRLSATALDRTRDRIVRLAAFR